jgi:hypothetical protein
MLTCSAVFVSNLGADCQGEMALLFSVRHVVGRLSWARVSGCHRV